MQPCTNAIYDGELEIDTAYTQTQLENAVKAGEFVPAQRGNGKCVS